MAQREKGLTMQDWWPEFDSWNTLKSRRKLTPRSSSLTFMHTLWFTHTNNNK